MNNTTSAAIYQHGPKWIALVLGLFLSGYAMAATLGEAKADGWVGEKPDGYIGLVRQSAGQ